MTYFNLRKRAAEEEPDEVEEQEPATEEEVEEQPEEEQPVKEYGPLLTGLFGPARWIAARFGARTSLVVHFVAVWAVAFYGGLIAVGTVAAWVFAVLLFTPREYLEKLAARVEQDTPGAEDDPVEDEVLKPGEGLARWLLDTIGERPGIHVRELYPAMRELPGQEGRTDADLKALLRAFGVPVHRSLRIGRIAGRTGVSRADVEALLPSRGERRVDSVVYAGQGEDSPPLSGGGEGV